MKRVLTFAVAAALAVGIGTTSWSQSGGSGGAGGASGSGGAAGATGTSGTTGVAGAGAAGAAGNVGVAGNQNVGATGSSNVGANAGGTGASGTVGTAGNAGVAGTPGNSGAAGTAGAVGATTVRPNVPAGATGTNAVPSQNNAATGQGFDPNFGGVSQTPFFTDSGARRQLNLNKNQFNTLSGSYRNAYSKYNRALSQLNPNLTAQQREQQTQQLQAQFNQELSGTVNSTLTDPQSRTRFDQLNRQFAGFNAFNDPAVRQQMNLTPQQARQLRTLSNNWRQQLQRFRQGAGNDLSSIDQTQWNQLQQQFGSQLNGVLTPEQQAMWSRQTGQPYNFAPNVVFGTQENGSNAANVAPFDAPQTGQLRTQQRGNVNTTTPQSTAQPRTQGAATPGTASQSGSQGTTR